MNELQGTEIRKARRKSLILLPAIGLMNRLSYPRKFLLISVFFLAALALVMYFLLLEVGERIDFTVKETVGTRYLRPMVKLFLDAGEARFVFGARGKSIAINLPISIEATVVNG